MGRILQALEESGEAENTIIVFTSEHGEMAGDHGILEKRTLYEEATRVPLLIHVPWISHNQKRIEGSISLVDLVPTLLDLVGDPIHGSGSYTHRLQNSLHYPHADLRYAKSINGTFYVGTDGFLSKSIDYQFEFGFFGKNI